ncbi:MAG: hypothetical protein JKX84_01980 [Flavobacteriales bacterium]|nr:hypothetical protein [Flavobacteriales bacterium]
MALIIINSSLLIHHSYAQTPPPSNPPSSDTPLDGMTSLLLVAGIGYGARKMRKNKKSVA